MTTCRVYTQSQLKVGGPPRFLPTVSFHSGRGNNTPGDVANPAYASDMSLVHREKIDRMIGEGKLVTPRWGVPDDVARVIRAFARGDFDYSTGQTIEVDGGLGMGRL